MLFLRQLLSNTRSQSLSQKKLEKERYLVKSLNNVREKTSLTDSVYLTVPSSEILPKNKT